MKSNEFISEIKKGQKDANGYTRCWPGKHAEGTKKGKNGGQVRNCVPNESVEEGAELKKVKRAYNQAAKDANADQVGAGKKIDTMKNSLRQKDVDNKKLGMSEAKEHSCTCTPKRHDPDCPVCKESVDEAKRPMSRVAKGNEKYGKDGMARLRKAKADGASEAEMDEIRDEENRYDESDELARLLVLGGLPLYEDHSPDEQFDLVEDMVTELAEEHGVDAEAIWEDFEAVDDIELYETAAWRRKEGKSKKGGLNAKGVASYRREHPGSKLQTAVTTKPSKLKPGSKAAKRRKSFCARMSGVKGPMKKPNGKPTRKALALRKWNC